MNDEQRKAMFAKQGSKGHGISSGIRAKSEKPVIRTKGMKGNRDSNYYTLKPNEKIYTINGVTFIDAGDGMLHSVHPNFHKSGSIRGMRDKYYGKDAKLVKAGDWIYNVDSLVYDKNNRLDMIALRNDHYKDEKAIQDLKDVGLL